MAIDGAHESTDQELEADEIYRDDEGSVSDDSNEAEDTEEEILARARKRFNLAVDAESDIRKEALEDLKFCSGEQWPPEIKYQRDQDKRPCLTINELPQYVRQITNDQRQNRPSIKINAIDLNANDEIAEIKEGLVRHIEEQSHAPIAYDTAFESAAKGGWGYFRVDHDFADHKSFDQEIFIKRVRNPFSIYFDPAAQEPDGSDGNWAHVFDQMSKEEFRAEFPDSTLSQMNDWTSVGDQSEGWITKDGCRISEYFEKKFKKKKLYLLTDGNAYFEDELPDPSTVPQGTTIKAERETVAITVCRYKINGLEILEKTECPGQYIPIIPVYGDEYIIEGKRKLEGVIRHAKDSQKMLNYYKSYEAETIALAPRSPWIMAEGQDENYEEMWKTANVRNHSALKYKPKSIGGVPIPPPQRNTFEPPVQAITQASIQASQDLKATTGIYDPEIGKRTSDQSGIAIQRLAHQSQVANFHLSDNFARSLRHCGRIINEWIPAIYDTPRPIRTIDPEGNQKVIWINRVFQENGQDKLIDLSKGKYDVSVDTGPSYQTKRQEAVASMLELTHALPPNQVAVITDLMVKNMDWPGAEQISERLKKTLPPGLVEQDGQAPIPPQAQQQIAQSRQMIQQLTQALNEKTQIINTKKLELESKERIEYEKLQADMRIEIMRTDASHAQIAFQEELALLRKRLDLLPPTPDSTLAPGGNSAAAQGQNPPQPTGGQPGQNPGAVQ